MARPADARRHWAPAGSSAPQMLALKACLLSVAHILGGVGAVEAAAGQAAIACPGGAQPHPRWAPHTHSPGDECVCPRGTACTGPTPSHALHCVVHATHVPSGGTGGAPAAPVVWFSFSRRCSGCLCVRAGTGTGAVERTIEAVDSRVHLAGAFLLVGFVVAYKYRPKLSALGVACARSADKTLAALSRHIGGGGGGGGGGGTTGSGGRVGDTDCDEGSGALARVAAHAADDHVACGQGMSRTCSH